MPTALRRRAFAIAGFTAILAAAVVFITPGVAHATNYRADLVYLKCDDESEAFSDEPFLELNGVQLASWSNVDGGDLLSFMPWHQSQVFFSGSELRILLREDDGHWSEDDTLGTFVLPASLADTGGHWATISTPGWTYHLWFGIATV